MGSSETAPCSGNCGIENIVTTVEAIAADYEVAAEQRASEAGADTVTLPANAQLVCARAKLFRHVYDNMPKQNCPGNQMSTEGEQHCPQRSQWNTILEAINVNGSFLSPEGESLVPQETADEIVADLAGKAARQQVMAAIGTERAREKFEADYPEETAKMKQAMGRAGAPGGLQLHPQQAPGSGSGLGQYL